MPGEGAPGQTFPSGELDVLGKLLQWPAARLFPALDIARLAMLHAHVDAHLAASAGPVELSPMGAFPPAWPPAQAAVSQAGAVLTLMHLLAGSFSCCAL